MNNSTRYTMLMASLPHLDSLFKTKQTPLSRLRLEQRLALLDTDDAALLARIEGLIQWGMHPVNRRDEEILRQAGELLGELEGPLAKTRNDAAPLRDLLAARLELRTLMAALRRRHRGETTPPAAKKTGAAPWGFGRWVMTIERNWAAPGFRLEGIYPWLGKAVGLLEHNQTLELERLLLSVVWEQLARAGQGHYFDFVAVVVYVLRWNIVERWTTYNRHAASQRFDTLVNAGLGQYGALFQRSEK